MRWEEKEVQIGDKDDIRHRLAQVMTFTPKRHVGQAGGDNQITTDVEEREENVSKRREIRKSKYSICGGQLKEEGFILHTFLLLTKEGTSTVKEYIIEWKELPAIMGQTCRIWGNP